MSAHYLTQHLNRFGKKRRSDRPSEVDFKEKKKSTPPPLKGWRLLSAKNFAPQGKPPKTGQCCMCDKKFEVGEQIAWLPRTRGFSSVALCVECYEKPETLDRIEKYRLQR